MKSINYSRLFRKARLIFVGFILSGPVLAGDFIYQDDFQGGLGSGWQVLNEKKEQWNIKDGELNAMVQGAGLWEGMPMTNNVFVRTVPDEFSAEVDVRLRPENAYEQASFGLYQDQDNYIKLCKEMFENRLSLVLVSETAGRPKVIERVDYTDPGVRFRLQKKGHRISAYYSSGEGKWLKLGELENHLRPDARIALLTLFGDALNERWAQFDNFVLSKP